MWPGRRTHVHRRRRRDRPGPGPASRGPECPEQARHPGRIRRRGDSGPDLGRPGIPGGRRKPSSRLRGQRGRGRGAGSPGRRRAMSRHARTLSLVLLLGAPAALAGAEVRIVNANGKGEGLNDQTGAYSPYGGNPGGSVGEQRLVAAQYAAALWSANLGNRVSISIRVSFANLDCSGNSAVLGTAGPTALYDNDRYPAALANERAGRDLDQGQEEILAQFNSRVGSSDCAVTAWYTGLDNAGPTGTTDLPSVLLHEFAHGLGFIRSVTAFRDQARDGTTGDLLSALTGSDYDAAIRRPQGLS